MVVGCVRDKGRGGSGILGWSGVRGCVGGGCEVWIRFGLGEFRDRIVFFRGWSYYSNCSLGVYDNHVENCAYKFL